MYPRKIECTIHRESFYEKQERKQETRYEVYLQNSKESSHREALRPVQETWGRIYHAQHTRLSQIREERKREIRLPSDQKRCKETQSHKPSFAQLCETMDKLEKVIKKQDTKRKKRSHSETDSNAE